MLFSRRQNKKNIDKKVIVVAWFHHGDTRVTEISYDKWDECEAHRRMEVHPEILSSHEGHLPALFERRDTGEMICVIVGKYPFEYSEEPNIPMHNNTQFTDKHLMYDHEGYRCSQYVSYLDLYRHARHEIKHSPKECLKRWRLDSTKRFGLSMMDRNAPTNLKYAQIQQDIEAEAKAFLLEYVFSFH